VKKDRISFGSKLTDILVLTEKPILREIYSTLRLKWQHQEAPEKLLSEPKWDDSIRDYASFDMAKRMHHVVGKVYVASFAFFLSLLISHQEG